MPEIYLIVFEFTPLSKYLFLEVKVLTGDSLGLLTDSCRLSTILLRDWIKVCIITLEV